jgi:outer membrane autotransporter protein
MGLAVNVINGNYRLHRLAQEHLATVRGSGREVSEASAPVTDAKGAIVSAGAASTRLEGRANAWGTFSFDSKDHQASGAGSDYDGDEGAITAGFDWLVASNLIVGLVLDGTKGDFDNSGFDSDVDGFRGAVYGTWGEATGFYSDALLGFGAHDLESSLSPAGVLLGGIGSDTSANSVQALWTAGYSMGNQSLKHGPYAGLEYQNVDVDSHTQSGPLPVSVGGYDVDSLRALIGYRINANLGTWRPYATLAYAHEFEDGATATTATLAGTAFTTRGAELGSAILITAGTGIDLTRGFIMDFGYRGEIATDDGMTSHGGSLGVNYSF